MAAEEIPVYITPEQYLEWEQEEEGKNEYYDGVIVAMSGVSLEHDRITAALGGLLFALLRGGPCRHSTPDMRVGVPVCNRYYYPDLAVTCGEPRMGRVKRAQSLLNPTVIVEVLSPSTERVDRDDKLRCYRTLDSLAVYVLVSQHTPRIETCTRQPDGAWRYDDMSGLDAVLALPVLNAQVRLADIYADVAFPVAPAPDTDAQDDTDTAS